MCWMLLDSIYRGSQRNQKAALTVIMHTVVHGCISNTDFH